MLRLTRKVGQSLCLYDEGGNLLFTVSVEKMGQGQVSIGIKSDPEKTKIRRKEQLEENK